MKNINVELFEFLLKKNLTISFCESASAGALSSFFCDIEGASKVFKGALITYSNESKINIAKVNPEFINLYGAVSEQVAIEMSKNTNKILNTDICISITGNSSSNVIENKPTCLYYVGITIVDKTYVYQIVQKDMGRNYNRFNIAHASIEKLLSILK